MGFFNLYIEKKTKKMKYIKLFENFTREDGTIIRNPGTSPVQSAQEDSETNLKDLHFNYNNELDLEALKNMYSSQSETINKAELSEMLKSTNQVLDKMLENSAGLDTKIKTILDQMKELLPSDTESLEEGSKKIDELISKSKELEPFFQGSNFSEDDFALKGHREELKKRILAGRK